MKIPVEIQEIVALVKKNNEEIYLVGGAVRNFLLKKDINDYDLTTSALPEKIEEIFSDYKTIDIGKKFGTILLLYKGYRVEITTFRKDGLYKDGRRPEKIEFSRSLREDLERRDFTINAMAMDEGLVIDYFKGREYLKNKLIKTVNNPDLRFQEDYLRILRAIRFAAQLDFKIEDESYEAIIRNREKIVTISKERIRDELFKLLLSPNPVYGLELLRKTGILKIILPDIDAMVDFDQESRHHDFNLYEHTLRVVGNTRQDLELRLAALFHDLGKLETKIRGEDGEAHYYGHNENSRDMAIKILKNFNTDKTTVENVANLVYYHMINNKYFKDKGIKRLINKLGDENIYKLIELQLADRKSCSLTYQDNEDIICMRGKIETILASQTVYNQKQLAINGNDVIELGYKKGILIGEILSFVLDLVLEDEKLNEREILINIIQEQFKDRREE